MDHYFTIGDPDAGPEVPADDTSNPRPAEASGHIAVIQIKLPAFWPKDPCPDRDAVYHLWNYLFKDQI